MKTAVIPEKKALAPPSTGRKIALAVIIASGTAIVVAAFFLASIRSPQLGWDFPQFYTAANLPIHAIYDPATFRAFGRESLAPLGVVYYPLYIRPAAFALVFRPLALLNYWAAFWMWAAFCLVAYLTSIILLLRSLRLPAYLVPAYAGFFPAIVGLIGGQDACVVLLAVVGAWLLLEQGLDWFAGAMIALCLYKYNLILMLPLLLIAKGRFRAFASFGIGAIILTAISAALASPRAYVNLLIESPKLTPGLWSVGLVGFSQAIGQRWCYPLLAVIAFAVCCWLMNRLPMTEAFCVAIVAMLLISPHIAWYDSALLALPIAVIFARSAIAIRIACLAVLVAYPLWRYGGGNNGPIGFTHVSVEVLIVAYFAAYALRTRGPAKPWNAYFGVNPTLLAAILRVTWP